MYLDDSKYFKTVWQLAQIGLMLIQIKLISVRFHPSLKMLFIG